jgi:tripartite-type tricarboxylate transporter receptor subunit TctC
MAISRTVTASWASAALCRQTLLVVAVVALAISAASGPTAFEAAFPQKPVKFVLGFGTGGPTDVIARTVADKMSNELGQRIVVENKTGASGNIATKFVAGADADGYTYLIGATPLAVNHSLFPDFPIQFGKDLIAIAPIGANANVLVVRPSLNVHTVADFVQRARSLVKNDQSEKNVQAIS